MELAFLTIRFDSPKEQKFVEKNCGFSIENKETWDEDSSYNSWTEFDVSGCKIEDLKIFEELKEKFKNKKD